MKLLTMLVISTVCTSVCAQEKHFEWLIGTWKIKDKNDYEVWTRTGSELSGHAFRIDGADTITAETITIVFKRFLSLYPGHSR
jgi:hypothetical protein